MTRVRDMKIGDRVKYNNTVITVIAKDKNKAIVSKNPGSGYNFSLSYTSSKFEDLENRFELKGATI